MAKFQNLRRLRQPLLTGSIQTTVILGVVLFVPYKGRDHYGDLNWVGIVCVWLGCTIVMTVLLALRDRYDTKGK